MQDELTTSHGALAATRETGVVSDRLVLTVTVLLIAAAYSNALSGDWVYDDKSQIAMNRLIQDPRNLGRALVSDVWAFSGLREKAWSNYWRPVFILWLFVNYQLFGLAPLGWHVTSILAHLGVTVLVFRVCRRLGCTPVVAALTTWVFAVHPVHVESVTWISGVTDVLAAMFLLSSYLVHLGNTWAATEPKEAAPYPNHSRGRLCLIAAPLLYCLALLSKEATVVFPAIIFLTHWFQGRQHGDASRASLARAVRRSIPFAAAAVVFVVLRYLVLGQMRIIAPGSPGWVGMLGTAPSVLVFYIRQALFPFILSPDNSLRPVTNADIGLRNFIIPLAVLVILIRLAPSILRRNILHRLAMIWFLLPILLALDIRVFRPDQIVNNRYLYLSIMGAFVLVGSAIAGAAESLWPDGPRRAARASLAAGLLLCGGMALLTHDYNTAWQNEVVLWKRAALVNPQSAHAYAQLGEAVRRAGDQDEAEAALTRALELDPDRTTPYIGLGIIAMNQGRFDEAERMLRKVIDRFPDYAVAVEQLGECYRRQNRFDEAIAAFRNGIAAMPYMRALYTMNIAVLNFMADRNSQALADLESLRPDLERDRNPSLFISWYYLGRLYQDLRRYREAGAAYDRYLSVTAQMHTPEVRTLRAQCLEYKSALPQD